MKVISLKANPYHKPGQVIETDEATANHLIEKGYAKAEGDDAEGEETKQKESEKQKPKKQK